ncbi:MFS transporter [Streptomyces hainanensis]|uniref:MFS transporter n=2 Tax=Streptomyces hainanensis TaxID=402648 RepID=A0A4R4TQT5_9ACTN|nr:MFS transporter [Streptomyces hainanensis]
MQLLDVTIVTAAIPALDVGQGAAQLVLTGYTLTYAGTLITAARLGDGHGYRRLFAAGVAVFTVASAACAAAPTAQVLVACRLVQGVGSGLMAPQVLSLIQVVVEAPRRPRALGLLAATMGLASLLGPLIGAVLLEGWGWRWIFLVNVPVGLAALVGAARWLPAARGAGRHRIDAAGAALATGGAALLILPLAVGREAGWPAWTWFCLAAAVLVLAGFVASQRPGGGREPLLHPSVFRDRTARTGVLLVFVFNAGVPSFSYVLFLHLRSGLGYPPLAAGLTAAPFAAAAMVGGRAARALTDRWGAGASTAAAATLTLVMLVLAAGPRWVMPPSLALGGAAFGVFTASVFALVLDRARPEAVGSVSGLLPTAQQLGGTVGVSAAGLVYHASAAGTAFRHALLYEAAAFALAALIARRLTAGSARAAVTRARRARRP